MKVSKNTCKIIWSDQKLRKLIKADLKNAAN